MHLGDKSYLEGIILSISTHSGPHIVYHYERETPLDYLSSAEHKFYNDQSDAESDIDWSNSDEDLEAKSPPLRPQIENLKKQFDKLADDLTEKRRPSVGGAEPLETLFAHDSSVLAEMLTPPRSMCNKRFQLTIDDKIFLGIPVHVGDSGRWTKEKESKKEIDTHENENENENEIEQEKEPESESDADGSPLIMFHLCFVLNPPIAEAQYVCDELYHHVLTQVVTLLRHEQRSRDYVWKEVKNMFDVKESGDGSSLIEKSELARALFTLFDSISVLKIAHLNISGKIRPFQVPIHREVHRIPMFVGEDSKFYGCQPTTAKNPDKEIEINCPDCYGLLLLDDPDKILKRIDAEPLGPLAALVHKINPTLSLEQMARENNIPVKQMINLAFSLVFWRCASIIIPLNHRYMYAVSPLAPMGKLYELTNLFKAQFPMMPPLPRFMSTLSTGKPQQYANHIPSRDHHLVYMHCLAWAMRHNLVVHIQSFGIMFVPHKIKLEVLREEEEQANSSDSEPDTGEHSQTQTRKGASHDNTSKPTNAKTKHIVMEKKRSDVYEEYERLLDSFIADPTRASLAEKKWIYKIASKHSTESQNLFYRLLKYFNGKDCLEQAFLHEKISRQEQRRFLQEYGENIIIYRHF